jgi:hypothetical protein
MGTHIPKVYQPKRAFNRPLTATCPIRNGPAIPSHPAPNQIGSMYSGWEATLDDLNHHQHVAHNDQGPSILMATVQHLAQYRASTRVVHRTHMLGNSLFLHSPPTLPKPHNSMAIGTRSTTCDELLPMHHRALFPSALVTSRPRQLKEAGHKSSVNQRPRPFPIRNPRFFQRIARKLCRRNRCIAMIRRRRQEDLWRTGGR